MSREFDNLNDLLLRFGYSGVPGNPLLDKKRQLAIFSIMFGAIDAEQVVRCGMYTHSVAKVSLSRLGSEKKSVLNRFPISDLSLSAYRAKSIESIKLSKRALDKMKAVLSDAAPVPPRAHDLFCSNFALSLAMSDVEAFRPLYGRYLLRGMSSVKEMLRVCTKETFSTNALVPDMVARKHVGSIFVEIDRATEKSSVVGGKIKDYFEVLRSVPVEELSSCSVVVSSFNYKQDKLFMGNRKRSLLKEPVLSSYSDACKKAAASLRKRTTDYFKGNDFMRCVNGGLRFFIVSGRDAWSPEYLNELFAVESGSLPVMLAPILQLNERAGEYLSGAFVRNTGGVTTCFPSVILPNKESGFNSTPIIYEHISADPCGRERALRLMTSKNFIRPEAGENAFLVMEADNMGDAEKFLSDVGKRDADLYLASDFRLSYLLKDGLYNTFRIFFRDGKPQYDIVGLGFIFRINGEFCLPANDDSFRAAFSKDENRASERGLA